MAHLPLNAPHGANRRQHASKKDNARQEKTARDEQRQAASSGAILSLSWCSEARGQKNFSGSRNFLGGKTDNPCEGKMTSRTQAPEHTISPEPDSYPAFVVHLGQITAWLQAGWSMKSIWQAYAACGAFPASYRTFLRYCNEHGLAPRRPTGAGENGVNGRDVASPAERADRIPPNNAALRGPKPVGSVLGRLNLYPPPLERPPGFIPSEED